MGSLVGGNGLGGCGGRMLVGCYEGLLAEGFRWWRLRGACWGWAGGCMGGGHGWMRKQSRVVWWLVGGVRGFVVPWLRLGCVVEMEW